MAKKMTNSQLVDENIRLREALALLEAKLASSEAPKVALPAPMRTAPAIATLKPQREEYHDYWTYVRAAKAWCKTNGLPISYQPR